MATIIDIGKLIVSSPDICGGRPRIAGKGQLINCPYSLYIYRRNAEKLLESISNKTLAS